VPSSRSILDLFFAGPPSAAIVCAAVDDLADEEAERLGGLARQREPPFEDLDAEIVDEVFRFAPVVPEMRAGGGDELPAVPSDDGLEDAVALGVRERFVGRNELGVKLELLGVDAVDVAGAADGGAFGSAHGGGVSF
jgi:hypothetical protein